MKSLWDTLGGPGCLDRMMPAYPARWPTLSRGVPTVAQSLEKAERPPLAPDIDEWKHQLKAILTRSPYDIDECEWRIYPDAADNSCGADQAVPRVRGRRVRRPSFATH